MSKDDTDDTEVDQLLACFLKFGVKYGPAFCKYGCDADKVPEAKLIVNGPEGVNGHHELLSSLRVIKQGLTFNASTIKAALKKLVEHKDIKREPG
eukprot:1432292-Pyramimonas_sp.AAC.1